MCKILKVSRSGYYKHISKTKSKRDIENEILTEYITKIFTNHKSRYGAKRLKVVLLNDHGLTLSVKRITRLMRKAGLYTKGTNYKLKYKKHISDVKTRNLVNQIFETDKKNQVWFGEITYILTNEGNMYLSVFIHLYTRKIVGYSLSDNMKASMVIDSLISAIAKKKPNSGLIVHSDQGSQYLSYDFLKVIRDNNQYQVVVIKEIHMITH
ncbi:transposase (tra5), orfB [Alteracholeplasma palmae J233]|uniref:Transposase (Tra5), orfB n=1 Tax=Alteracholeplasma palmae (strain ATCC 49389 / J233) TaxID=1318466 RepID=U4KJW7_ALTPJ|nr:transposase (tra5), orfB [Alteracholeplasma palmae J233]